MSWHRVEVGISIFKKISPMYFSHLLPGPWTIAVTIEGLVLWFFFFFWIKPPAGYHTPSLVGVTHFTTDSWDRILVGVREQKLDGREGIYIQSWSCSNSICRVILKYLTTNGIWELSCQNRCYLIPGLLIDTPLAVRISVLRCWHLLTLSHCKFIPLSAVS